MELKPIPGDASAFVRVDAEGRVVGICEKCGSEYHEKTPLDLVALRQENGERRKLREELRTSDAHQTIWVLARNGTPEDRIDALLAEVERLRVRSEKHELVFRIFDAIGQNGRRDVLAKLQKDSLTDAELLDWFTSMVLELERLRAERETMIDDWKRSNVEKNAEIAILRQRLANETGHEPGCTCYTCRPSHLSY